MGNSDLRFRNKQEEEEEVPMHWSAQIFHQRYLNLGILFIMGFKTQVNYDHIVAGFEQTLAKIPSFSSLQVEDTENKGKMKWVRIKPNMKAHVVVPTLVADEELNDQLVEDYIAGLSTTRFDKSKPLWEYHILNIKTSEAEATGVFKMHHSLGDGISLISLFFAMSRKASDPAAIPTLPAKTKAAPSPNSTSWPILGYLIILWSIFVKLFQAFVNIFSFAATLLFLKDTKTFLSRRRGVTLAPRRFVHRTLSLHDIKLVKNEMKATINDVVVGITQAALSRYLCRRYEETKASEGKSRKKSRLPGNIRLRAAVMANVRPSPGIQDIASMMEKNSEDKWGILVGFITLPLSISAQDSVLDHIRRAKLAMDRKKSGLEAGFAYSSANLVAKMFGIKAVSGLIYKIWVRTTATFSNLVGPAEDITFFGHEVAYIAPTVYGVPQALVIHFQSFANKMMIVLSVDERSIPDPHRLCNDFEESLNKMKVAVTKKSA